MAYIRRHIEEKLLEAAAAGCGITLCGPHLAGKRTTLEHLFPGREILPAEGYADALRIEGTNPDAGDRTFHLLGLSMRELAGDDFREPFLPTEEYLSRRNTKILYDDTKLENRYDLLADVLRGCLPPLKTEEKYTSVPSRDFDSPAAFGNGNGTVNFGVFWYEYLEEYQNKLAQEGVPGAEAAKRIINLMLFFRIRVPRYEWYARMTNESVENMRALVQRFEKDDLIYVLRPLEENTSRPVDPEQLLHYLDSGMEANAANPVGESIGRNWPENFRSYIISEIVKSCYNAGITPELYHFRDPDSDAAADLVMRFGKDLYPIQINNGREPFEESLKFLSRFRSFYRRYNVHDGAVICWAKEPYRADKRTLVIPFNYI